MDIMVDYLISFFVVLGGLFGLIGSFGLIRLKDTMQRLHGPTKATTLGVGGVLIGSMFWFASQDGHISFHELLITIFLFLTAPITAHFMAQTHIRLHLRESDLPKTGRAANWSVYRDRSGE